MEFKNNNGSKLKTFLFALTGLLIFLYGAYQIPSINRRLSWRIDAARASLKRIVDPVGALPTAAPVAATEQQILATPIVRTTSFPTATATTVTEKVVEPEPVKTEIVETPTPTPTPTQIPERVLLDPPEYKQTDAQDWNNCGPATLALYLRFYGWEGDQYTISDEIKPIRADRNVNIEDLTYYVWQDLWWLKADFRVGGSIELIKKFIAAGIPIVVEESFVLEEGAQGIAGPDDDRWTGHYLLLTGYDDELKTFFSQDTYRGPNEPVTYQDLDRNWQSFNRAFIFIYPAEEEDVVKGILGEDWDPEQNRMNALQTAKEETQDNPENAFAWFNLGSNYTYFSQYQDGMIAYDRAREIGLPQRMLRYQFGPFLAYFHGGRTEELLTLAEYALEVTPNSEEALLWRGWALYRMGKREEALQSFREALEARPGYGDAEYAINFVFQN